MDTRIGIAISRVAKAGAELQAILLATQLADSGTSVSLLSIAPLEAGSERLIDELLEKGVEVKSANSELSLLGSIRARKAVKKWIANFRPNVVFAMLTWSEIACTSVFGSQGKVPLVLYRGDLSSTRGDSKMKRLIRRLLLSRAQLVVANSHAVAEDSANFEGQSLERYSIIYNGLPKSAFESTAPILIDTELPVLVSTANLRIPKAHEVLIDAAVLLKERDIPVCCILVGDGVRRAELEEYANFQDIDCHFVGSVEDPRPYLSRAAIFVQHSDSEGMSNSLLEAMAAGVPIVATDVGGTVEALNGCWETVSRRDPEAIASRVEYLINNPEETAIRAIEAKKRAQSFSLEHMADSYLTIARHI